LTYRAALGFLDSLANYERQAKPRNRFKLDSIRRLLTRAGEPQARMPATVLVAGTKGKGSVCYMLDAALRACGLRTGLFVSPHVLDVRERIQLGGRPVGQAAFARSVERLRPLVRSTPVSYFELTAAMAFELFARSRLDYAVVEVGLGGRLDATNLTSPAVSVITRIGYDHVQVLGRTLRKIAGEKAGIMRPDRSVVVAAQEQEAFDALAAQARRVGADFVSAVARTRAWDIECSLGGTRFSFFCDLGPGRAELPLLGRHQVENCLTALTVLGLLSRADPRVRVEPVLEGLRSVAVPARCQVVQSDPPVIVDSCHNPESGRALAGVISECIGQPVILVYGSLRNKLVAKTIEPLVPWVRGMVATRPDSPRAMEPADVRRAVRRFGLRPDVSPNAAGAMERARLLSAGRLPVVVAGSFYLAGEVLRLLTRRP
jgi:dihydrofolate synthase/folylpolyglutamate synthase